MVSSVTQMTSAAPSVNAMCRSGVPDAVAVAVAVFPDAVVSVLLLPELAKV